MAKKSGYHEQHAEDGTGCSRLFTRDLSRLFTCWPLQYWAVERENDASFFPFSARCCGLSTFFPFPSPFLSVSPRSSSSRSNCAYTSLVQTRIRDTGPVLLSLFYTQSSFADTKSSSFSVISLLYSPSPRYMHSLSSSTMKESLLSGHSAIVPVKLLTTTMRIRLSGKNIAGRRMTFSKWPTIILWRFLSLFATRSVSRSSFSFSLSISPSHYTT